MHEFVKKFQAHLGRVAVRMNACLSMQQCVDNVASTKMILPDGAEIWIRYPQVADTCEEPCGEAYLSDYDIWSPELAADDLAEWVDMSLECCRRIDAYYDKQRTSMRALNSSVSADIKDRVKNVWRSALAAIDLPRGFRYTGFRTNNLEDWVLSTLVYYSDRIHQQTWLIKSGLILEPEAEGPDVDGWSFQPVYRPLSEAVHNMRPGYSVDMGTELYVEFFNGETPEKRDKQAAYWLVQILSDIVDEAIKNPPPRCYEVLLADNAANLKKSDLERMSDKGIYSLLSKGILTGEQVLKGRPDLWKKLLEKGYVSAEMVARRVPEQLFWLVKNHRITADYALKLQPSLKEKLVKAGLYTENDLSGYDDVELIRGAEDGTLNPVDVYRANPKLLTTMVEQAIITPQEAYKLDAAIVTWLLINHYIGRAEAKRVKSDIERYVKQKHKDVDWESLDAARHSNSSTTNPRSKKSPRRLNINSNTTARAKLAGDRTIGGTHFFCVEGKGIGDSMQNQQQLQTYLPGYEVSSSGYADRLYVDAPADAKDIVEIAVQHFNRDVASDLNSCGGVTQVGDIAQTTTFPEKKSINSDLTEDNAQLNDEIRELGNLALSGLVDINETTATGPAWKVTIKYPGDLLSDYTTPLLIPALDKAAAQVKFNENMGDDVSIISWDEEVNSIDAYKEKYPQSNIKVLE